MNDDFSGPPGMDARRADGDRDVAWARGLKNRENEGERSRSEKLGSVLPARGGPTLGKFPWEAAGIADLKVVYRKPISLKLWDSSGHQAAFYNDKLTSASALLTCVRECSATALHWWSGLHHKKE